MSQAFNATAEGSACHQDEYRDDGEQRGHGQGRARGVGARHSSSFFYLM